MLPRYLNGDMVRVTPMNFTGSYTVPAMIISVQQANCIPDAAVRGLSAFQDWSFYVMTTGGDGFPPQFIGPLPAYQVWPWPN